MLGLIRVYSGSAPAIRDFFLGAFSGCFTALPDAICDELINFRFGESTGAESNLYRRLDTASSYELIDSGAADSNSGAGFTHSN